ncbi:MAG: ABC transporter permease [Acidimicrobiia bacterium]
MDGVTSWFEYMVDRADDIAVGLYEHAIYIVTVVIVATITSLVVGILVRHRPVAKEISLGIASVFLTLPSLALFTIFIPLTGLGFLPSFIALYLYAILPILRNTVTGLAGVDPAVLESARGMGLSSWQRLRKIEIPLAWPVIITGIRISSLLTAGIAAIATLVAGGGLGDFIKSGLARLPLPNSLEAIWTGTVFTVLLALAFDVLFTLVSRLTTSPGLRP